MSRWIPLGASGTGDTFGVASRFHGVVSDRACGFGGHKMRVVQKQACLRRLSKSVLLLAVFSALGTTPLLADTITVDENGNGSYVSGGTTTPIQMTTSGAAGQPSLTFSPEWAPSRALPSSYPVQETLPAHPLHRCQLPAAMSLLFPLGTSDVYIGSLQRS